MQSKIPTRNDAWVRWARLIGALFVAATVLALMSGCGPRDDSDPADGRSGIVPRTDALTGCQYLTYGKVYGAAITPRMAADGKQVCR